MQTFLCASGMTGPQPRLAAAHFALALSRTPEGCLRMALQPAPHLVVWHIKLSRQLVAQLPGLVLVRHPLQALQDLQCTHALVSALHCLDAPGRKQPQAACLAP